MTNIGREGAKRMTIARIVALIGILSLAASPARAQISDGVVKIGVLNDQSSLYADLAGQGSVVAARMAVEDFGAAAKGLKVDIVFADHQNKADEHTSELQSLAYLVCRLLLEKKKTIALHT